MAIDEVFRALSDPTRRAVVRLLREEGPLTAGEIADRFDLAKSTMSGHFAVLKQAGLLVVERQGARLVYGLRQDWVCCHPPSCCRPQGFDLVDSVSAVFA